MSVCLQRRLQEERTCGAYTVLVNSTCKMIIHQEHYLTIALLFKLYINLSYKLNSFHAYILWCEYFYMKFYSFNSFVPIFEHIKYNLIKLTKYYLFVWWFPLYLLLDNMMFNSGKIPLPCLFWYVYIDIYILMKDHIFVHIETFDTQSKTFWRKSSLMHKLHLY